MLDPRAEVIFRIQIRRTKMDASPAVKGVDLAAQGEISQLQVDA